MAKGNTSEVESLKARIAQLEAEKNAGKVISFKVSPKGAVSVYGLQRWPVTLYREQWDRLLDPGTVNKLREFIKANAAKLSVKGEE